MLCLPMRVLRKFVAFIVYAAILLPGTGPDIRWTAWFRAVEMTSTALDRTLRRKKSAIENENLALTMRLTQIADGDRQDMTGRIRHGRFV
jgi:hypothetical protein